MEESSDGDTAGTRTAQVGPIGLLAGALRPASIRSSVTAAARGSDGGERRQMSRLSTYSRRVAALATILGVVGIAATAAMAETASTDSRYIVTFVSGTSDAQQAADIEAAGATDISA